VVSSDQFKGKVVVLDFWATWCPPCRSEIPGYVELQKKYAADGLVFVGVSVDEDGPEVVKKFIKDHGINYTIVMATRTSSAPSGRSTGSRPPSSSTATGTSGTKIGARARGALREGDPRRPAALPES
jgi:thiol-disulfide isomerase/thioredoxin